MAGDDESFVEEGRTELSCSVWPARERPHGAVIGVVFAVGVSVYVYHSFGSIAYTVIALVVLLASFISVFVPSVYRFDDDGIEKSSFLSSKSRSWSELACFVRRGELIGVSRELEPTHESLSGGFLIRHHERADEIAEFVSRYLPECEVVDEQ